MSELIILIIKMILTLKIMSKEMATIYTLHFIRGGYVMKFAIIEEIIYILVNYHNDELITKWVK